MPVPFGAEVVSIPSHRDTLLTGPGDRPGGLRRYFNDSMHRIETNLTTEDKEELLFDCIRFAFILSDYSYVKYVWHSRQITRAACIAGTGS